MPPDPDAADPDIVGRIPLTAKTVLEVGCGTGVLAEEYKRRNPACRYFGIEIDPVSARVAATRMDSVANVDVELDPLPFGPEMFDCIVYGGVLADLRDPWAVLRQHAQALSATGIIVASVLNLDHWSFAERLLRGTWNYEDHGLFSRSHLRVPIDLASGVLREGLWFARPGRRFAHAWWNGAPLAGRRVTGFAEAVAAARRAMGLLPGLALVSWKVIVAPRGPVILGGDAGGDWILTCLGADPGPLVDLLERWSDWSDAKSA